MLTLSEEIFLLSMVEKRRSVAVSNSAILPYLLAGAILYELISRERIKVDEDNKLWVIDDSPAEDERLNEVIRKIQAEDRQRKLAYWVEKNRIQTEDLTSALLLNLVIKGIIKEEDKRYLWVIPTRKYFELGASAKYWRKQQLRSIVLGGETIDEQSVAVLSLVRACELVDLVFTKDELKRADRRIFEIIRECEKETPRIAVLGDIAETILSAANADQ